MPSEIPLFRIGQGYDIHPFKDGRRLVLGGVAFDSPRGLDGHSDADVLSHAICDALLGAAGLPDIGHYFPNTDPTFKDISSQELLKEVAATIDAAGWQVANIDSTIIAEQPRIYPFIGEMKERLADSLGIEPDQIGVKATTNEQLGALGRGEGIAALAVAMILKIPE